MNTPVSSAEISQNTQNTNQNPVSTTARNMAEDIISILVERRKKGKREIVQRCLLPKKIWKKNIQYHIQYAQKCREGNKKNGRPGIDHEKYTVSEDIQVVFEAVGITDKNLMIDILAYSGLLAYPIYTYDIYENFHQFIDAKHELEDQISSDRRLSSETHSGRDRNKESLHYSGNEGSIWEDDFL